MLLGCLVAGLLPAAEPLPEPLTLAAALRFADAGHPDLQLAAAGIEAARAEGLRARALTGVRASLEAEARYVGVSPLAADTSPNDSRARLQLNKRLYDFGRSRASLAAAAAAQRAQQARYLDTRLQRRLDILGRYLDVLLADLDFRVQDEAMSIAYVRLDRARDRFELGQISEIELLRRENDYQVLRSRRYAAEAARRTRRVRLAEALGRPGELSRTLVEPGWRVDALELPELEALTREVLAANPGLRALQAELEQARQRVQAARAGRRPVLSGELATSRYARDYGFRDRWEAGLVLEVPLFTGGRVAAELAAAQARRQEAEAELALAQRDLRQRVAELWEEIRVLRAQRQETQTRLDYRDLYLDRSRALYELEVETDLGDAMTLSTEARLREAQRGYRLLLAWAELDALRGKNRWLPLAATEEEGVKP
ncbi:TolC family protein [Thiohalobacter sp. IOR34]|uniref:TolC family protein n=1 Tax=Thiohalobacter sp. IOR34 TaxID=3057176 RepID=UPI0025B09B14|nr:TolC family protein [Thiohalobacter sp. IOR34]WJW76128.1 TolC family protein [Thiohalobacter sp. IOR34]